jgi:ABC-type lipoprotein release transport system permease subunit
MERPALRRAFSCPNTRVYIDRAPRFLASFLFGVKAWDPIAFIVTPVLLSAVALFAVWIPAKRATSVDPMTALRLE